MSDTWTLTAKTTLTTEECCRCGVMFAMPSDLMDDLIQSRRSFYCPNGHSQAYVGETDAEKLRRALAREKAVRDQLDAAERSRSALKGQTTKLRNQMERVENGVCPHCNRSFADLRSHMTTKHPVAR